MCVIFCSFQFSSKSCRTAITCICLYATAAALYSAATASDVSANVPPGARQWTSSICSYAQQKRFNTKRWRTQANSYTKCVSSLTFSRWLCLFLFLFFCVWHLATSCWLCVSGSIYTRIWMVQLPKRFILQAVRAHNLWMHVRCQVATDNYFRVIFCLVI